ncbi:carboxypeptidase-like regulatory domain-containing protein [Pimelobacter simplex]
MHLDNSAPLPPIALRDRLTLTGNVVDADGVPFVDALVVLTRQSGEVVSSIRTDHEGRYVMTRPANGRYVLSVAAREGQMGARAVTLLDTAYDVDLVLGTPLA